MNDNCKQIPATRLALSAGCFIQGSTLLAYAVHFYCRQDAWSAVLLGFVLCIPFLAIYRTLAVCFPGKSLIEINHTVLGKWIGSLFSVLYLFFFFTLAILNTRLLGDFVKEYVLPNTPMAISVSLFIFVCCLAARHGAAVIARYGAFFVILVFFLFALTSVLLIKNMDAENFLPMFAESPADCAKGAFYVAMLPMGEVVVMLMMTPWLSKPDDAGKVFRGGALIGGVTLLIVVLRIIAVLGVMALHTQSPNYYVVCLIDVGTILTRMEVLYSIILISLLFYKISVLLFAVSSGLGRLLKLDSCRFLVFTMGALTVVFAQSVFPSSMEHMVWLKSTASVYSSLFVAVLPTITIVVAALRGLLRKKKGAENVCSQ